MRRWISPQPDLFKTSTLNIRSALPQRTIALELLKVLLIEAMSATEARNDGMDDQETGYDQDHA